MRVIAEPGRFFVASAFTLAVNVIARRALGRDEISNDGRRGPSILTHAAQYLGMAASYELQW